VDSTILKMKYIILKLSLLGAIFASCNSQNFQDQIKNDLTSKLPSGICDSIPKGSTITNLKIGEIVDIGMDGMTDVSYELDFEYNGVKKHRKSAMLYIKNGNKYKLASLGDCKYEMK
jgi:hypothetical protein